MSEPEKPDASPEAKAGRRVEDWWDKYKFYIYIAGLLMLLCVGYFWDRMVITIQAGSHGVRYKRLAHGTVIDKVWGEGTYFIPPWDTLTPYETRLQERTVSFPALTKDGLEIAMTVSIRYYPLVATLGLLHKDVGPDYFKRLIQPAIEAFLRRVIGEHRAEEIYASQGDFVNEATHVTLTVKDSMDPYVHIDAVLLRELHLPDIVRRAINEKHQQEQMVLSYNFRIETEEKEAERKRVEASGIHDYNLIAGTISPDLLRWRGIEATLALASSPNAKVVVIGNKEGMPLILDTATVPPTPAAAAAPAAPAAPAPLANPPFAAALGLNRVGAGSAAPARPIPSDQAGGLPAALPVDDDTAHPPAPSTPPPPVPTPPPSPAGTAASPAPRVQPPDAPAPRVP